MMETMLKASYRAKLLEHGSPTMQAMNLRAAPGENIYLYGNSGRRQLHFTTLAGQRMPEDGTVSLNGHDFYSDPQLPAYRRDHVGILPSGGGLIPELTVLEQITLPMKMAQWPREKILERLRTLTGPHFPSHDLYNRPKRCSLRKQAAASVLRMLAMEPEILLIDGFLDDFEELDGDILWDLIAQHRRPDSILIYLSGAPAPERIHWTQTIRL